MSASAICNKRFRAGLRTLYAITTAAAKAVKMDNKRDFAGELMDEKIPKATPVFWTYVMLKKPSITETDSFRLNRF